MVSMIHKPRNGFLFTIILIFALYPAIALSDTTTPEGFLKEINTAVKNKDKDAIVSLCNWEGIEEKDGSHGMMMIDLIFKQELKSIDFETLPSDYPTTLPTGGPLLKLNTPPKGLVKFTTKKKVGFTGWGMPYGIKDGKYCFSLFATADGSNPDFKNIMKKDDRYNSPEKTWELHKDSLLKGDLQGAVNCLAPGYGTEFIEIYEILGKDKFKEIAAGMRSIQKIRQDEKTAKYRIRKKEKGQNATYYIHFINIGGNWKIEDY